MIFDASKLAFGLLVSFSVFTMVDEMLVCLTYFMSSVHVYLRMLKYRMEITSDVSEP